MKIIRLCVAAAMLSALLLATPLQAATNHSGSYFNAAQTGHGLVLEELESGLIVAYWYTYRADGTSTFLFGVLSGSDGTFTGDLSITEGMVFGDFDPGTNVTSPWGSLSVTFNHCGEIDVSWTTSADGFSNGSTTMQRLTNLEGAGCRNVATHGTYAITLTSTTGITSGTAILLEDGTMSYMFNDHIGGSWAGFGTYEETGDGTFDYDTAFYPNNGSEMTEFAGNADHTPDGFTTVANGTQMKAVRTPAEQMDLAQGDLAGDYDISAGGFNLGTATIEDDGSFAGDIFGCVLAGTATVADPNFNQFGIETDTSGACPAGTINGAGFVDEIGNIVLMAVETTNGTGYVLNLIKK